MLNSAISTISRVIFAMSDIVCIATRQSPLALWQAEHVRVLLMAHHEGLEVELVKMVTQGDKILDTPLAKIGGKGLFVKELEQAMLEGRADLAVHSMKDVPVELPDGLQLSVILEREEPRDAFVSERFDRFADLPEGAHVGTSSLRRQLQLLRQRPDLKISSLRGNVGTRLKRLEEGQFDAIILASAGLIRLGLNDHISEYLSTEVCLPAIGQGAIGIESRTGDARIDKLLVCLDDPDTHCRVLAERAFNARLQGGCQVPIGGHAVLDGDILNLKGLVGEVDGSRIIEGERTGSRHHGVAMGESLADEILDGGGREILAAIYQDGGAARV